MYKLLEPNNNVVQSFIDFSTVINSLGPSPMALDALRRGVSLIRHYPDPDSRELKMAFSRFLNTPVENILLGNGETEIIHSLIKALSPKRLLLPIPLMEQRGELPADIPVEYLILNRGNTFSFPVKSLQNTLQPGDLILISNPNNPTGMLIPRKRMEKIAEEVRRKGAVLVVDEAYMDFVEENETLLPECIENPALIVIGSLTKFFAMPGLQLGYLAADKSIVKKVAQVMLPWRINIMAQLAGKASLEDTSYIMTTLKFTKRERDFLIYGLRQIRGLKVYPSSANFILVNCKNTGKTAYELSEQLRMRGILIQVAECLPVLDQYYFRISVRQRNDNLTLLKKLREVLCNL